jgi:hypothetical protein
MEEGLSMKKFLLEALKVALLCAYAVIVFLFSMVWITFVVCMAALPFAVVILLVVWAVNYFLLLN